MEQKLTKLEKLEDDIWRTRKCRIIASERLNSNERFCRFMSIYYSILTTVLTIINMFGEENKNIDILILVVSIAATNFLLYLDTQNYKDRYLSLKKNYLDLAKLQIKINSVDNKENMDVYNEIALEYNELLREVENHKEYDYIKLQLETKNLKNEVSTKNKIIYYSKVIFNWILKMILVVIPAIFLINEVLTLF